MKNYKANKLLFLLTILLGLFLMIASFCFINKYVFSSPDNDLTVSDKYIYENGLMLLIENTNTGTAESSSIEATTIENPILETQVSENPIKENVITEDQISETHVFELPEEKTSIEDSPALDNLLEETNRPEDLISEELISEELISEELISEDLISEDLISEDLISEDLIPEELISEDLISEDLISEELISEDLISEIPVTDITVLDVPVEETPVTISVKQEKIISQMDNDYHVIPDKYNTGCKGKLEKVTGSFFAGEIELRESGGKITFDFFYRNKDASGTYVIENYDFSNFGLAFNSESKVSGKKINIVFNNCKFSTINTMRQSSEVFTYTFNDCTIRQFLGSNSTFNRCKFGDSYSDCMIPFNNITVKDCYFSNLASNDTTGNGKHSDGTQMYGYSDSMVQNVLFSNCRFEIPAVKTTQSTAAVNACVTLGLEYNNAKNVKVENCILNGGGYTIYATKKHDQLSMSEVYFTNIKVGDAKLFGSIYPSIAENVTFTNVVDQDSLYVSSVWYDGAKTHIIVSNDTSKERILRVVTGTTSKDYTIKACLGGSALRYDNFDLSFEEFPFDIDISIDAKKDYVLCFDVTDGIEKQIRYVSFDNMPTYYTVEANAEPILNGGYIIEGKCGNDITYTLDKEGTLKIEGKGAMFNYDSKKPAPWSEYATSVVNVELSEGITHIGTQAFRKMINIQSIKLPKTLTKIGSNAFIGCGGLKYLTFYSGVTNIGKYAFNGTKLIKCNYYGSEDEWNSITIEANNNPLLNCERIYESN